MKWKSFSNFHLKPTLCELKGDHKRNLKKCCGSSYGALFYSSLANVKTLDKNDSIGPLFQILHVSIKT